METLQWLDGTLRFLDQTELPLREVYVEAREYRRVAEAIRALRIRGAPAIGVAAAYGACLSVWDSPAGSLEALRADLADAVEHLAGTRPTAVNLFYALNLIKKTASDPTIEDAQSLRDRLLATARRIHEADRESCRRMALLGASLFSGRVQVLTHCNTGALATGGEGTALGVIIEGYRQGTVTHVFVDETRPLLQGARLTAWELLHNSVPVTLITDSTAGFLMRQGKVHAVLVGADRIAANGDTANKVGTYSLSVLAEKHGIPMYIVAPRSTIDLSIGSGEWIPIEERDPGEVTHVGGVQIAPVGVGVYAPAFDITPNQLISAIVTEKGIVRPPFAQGLKAVMTMEE